MRRSLIAIAAAGALAVVPAAAFAGAASMLNVPASKLLPMKIGTPTATLTTGGSVVQVKIPVTATGNQGFSQPVEVEACLGAVGCEDVKVSVKGSGVKSGTVKFALNDTVQGPVKVSLQITAQTQAFRSVLKTFTVTAR
ncbi:MAG: hypothetical protein ACO3PB_03035 [Miltoncostaeaceae bacterium]